MSINKSRNKKFCVRPTPVLTAITRKQKPANCQKSHQNEPAHNRASCQGLSILKEKRISWLGLRDGSVEVLLSHETGRKKGKKAKIRACFCKCDPTSLSETRQRTIALHVRAFPYLRTKGFRGWGSGMGSLRHFYRTKQGEKRAKKRKFELIFACATQHLSPKRGSAQSRFMSGPFHT